MNGDSGAAHFQGIILKGMRSGGWEVQGQVLVLAMPKFLPLLPESRLDSQSLLF
jgi:hypothetical protein